MGLVSAGDGVFFSVYDDDVNANQLWLAKGFGQIPKYDSGTLGLNYDIRALTSSNSGLFAIDGSNPAFNLLGITLDPAGTATGATTLGPLVQSSTRAAILGVSALEAGPSTGTLYTVGYTADQLAPSVNLGSLGATVTAIDLTVDTVDSARPAFILARENTGVRLYRTGFNNDGSPQTPTAVGSATLNLAGGEIHNALAVSFDAANNRILTIGTIDTGTDYHLFGVNKASGAVTDLGTVHEGSFTLNSAGGPVTALTFQGGVYYAIFRLGSTDRLLRVGPNGAFTTVGDIAVGGSATNIKSLGVNGDGLLIGVDDTSNGRRLVGINIGSPANSSAFTSATLTTISSSLAGLAWNSAGRFLSVSGGSIYASAASLSRSLFTLSSTNGLATSRGTLSDGVPVVDNITNLAFNLAGDTLYAIRRDTGNRDRLVTIGIAPAADGTARIAPVGTSRVQVNGADTRLVGLDTDTAGNLVGIDAAPGGGRQLVQLNLTNPPQSSLLSLPGDVSSSLRSYTSDASGRFFSIFDNDVNANRLMVSGSVFTPGPVSGGGLGGTFDVRDLAVSAAGRIYAVVGTTGGTGGPFLLYEALRRDGGKIESFNRIGAFQVGSQVLDNVTTIEADPATGLLYVIATAGTSTRNLYRVNPATGAASFVGSLGITDDITAMAFSLDGSTLYGVRHVSPERLVTINKNTGAITDIGAIQVGGGATRIVAMDTDVTGSLFAIDQNNAGLRRLIVVNAATPAASTQVADYGSVPTQFRGYASDSTGHFFSIFNNSAVDPTANDVLYTSRAQPNAPGTAGNGDLGGDFNFSAITVAPDTSLSTTNGKVYGVNLEDSDLVLYQLGNGRDAATGTTRLGKITNAQGAAIADIHAIDSNSSGVLEAVGFNAQAPVPTDSIGAVTGFTAAGTAYNFVATTVTDTDRILAVNRNNNGTPGNLNDDYFELYEFNRTEPGIGGVVSALHRIGVVRDSQGANILNIVALETDPETGKVYTVGTRNGSANRELFELNLTTGFALSLGLIKIDFNNTGTPQNLTSDITALAIHQITQQITTSSSTTTTTTGTTTGTSSSAGTFPPLIAGSGGGSIIVSPDAFGSFGSAIGGTNVTDGEYTPIGGESAAGTTFESGIAVGTTSGRTFLTAGSIGSSAGGTVVTPVSGTSGSVTSTFTFGSLRFDLVQTVAPRLTNGVVSGSALTQTYTITNTGNAANSFEVIRYIDGDLFFDGTLIDGGGRLATGPGGDTLFETDRGGTASTSTTFLGITATGGEVPVDNRYEISNYFALGSRIIAGTPLANRIDGDTTGTGFIDAGHEYDVTLALRNIFNLAAGASSTYTTETLFGTGAPDQTTTTPTTSTTTVTKTQMVGTIHDTSGTDRLVTISLTDPIDTNNDGKSDSFLAESAGLIKVGTGNTAITSMDFNASGDLLAFDRPASGQARIIKVDTAAPSTGTRATTPQGATIGSLAGLGSTNPVTNLVGFTSDSTGHYYSLYDDNTSGNIQIRTNPNILYTIGTSPADLNGDGKTDEVLATPLVSLSRPNPLGPGSIAVVNPVAALAFANPDGSGSLRAVLDFEGDPTPFSIQVTSGGPNGGVISVGQTYISINTATGATSNPTALQVPDDALSAGSFSPAKVLWMDASKDGRMIAVEETLGTGQRRLAEIGGLPGPIIGGTRLFVEDEYVDQFNYTIPSEFVNPITVAGAVPDSLVGYSSSSNGDAFYSVYDDNSLSNILYRSFFDYQKSVPTEVDHVPLPNYTGSLFAGDDTYINALAASPILDGSGNQTIYLEGFDKFDPNRIPTLYTANRDANGNAIGNTTIGALSNAHSSVISQFGDMTSDPIDLATPTLGAAFSASDLGERKFSGVTVGADGRVWAIDVTGGNPFLVELDPTTRSVRSVAPVLVGGLSILGLSAIEANPSSGNLYGIAQNASNLIPTIDKGSLGDAVPLSLTVGTGANGSVYEVIRNDNGTVGTSDDFFQLVVSTRNGAGNITSVGSASTIQDTYTNRISDVSGAVQLPDGSFVTTGFNAGAPAPNAPVGANLDGIFNIVGVGTVGGATPTVYGEGAFGVARDLYRLPVGGGAAVRIGQINETSTGDAILNGSAFTGGPGSALYATGYRAGLLAPSTDLGGFVLPDLGGTVVSLGVQTTSATQDVYAVVVPTGGTTSNLYRITRDNTGAIASVNNLGVIRIGADPITNIRSLVFTGNRFLAVGTVPTPPPANSPPGTAAVN
ncbi:MAG: hypothetical protein NTW19_11080, partial [Planctomycetota bacterium]|nr:hypothetical protein [Planctomycetota bacterium]